MLVCLSVRQRKLGYPDGNQSIKQIIHNNSGYLKEKSEVWEVQFIGD